MFVVRRKYTSSKRGVLCGVVRKDAAEGGLLASKALAIVDGTGSSHSNGDDALEDAVRGALSSGSVEVAWVARRQSDDGRAKHGANRASRMVPQYDVELGEGSTRQRIPARVMPTTNGPTRRPTVMMSYELRAKGHDSVFFLRRKLDGCEFCVYWRVPPSCVQLYAF